MKKMKSRIIAFAMALVCLLGVAGCGKSSDNSDSGKTSEKSSDKKGSSGGAEEVVEYSMGSSRNGARVMVFTNKGNAYYIGKGSTGSTKGEADVDKPTKFLENVKHLISSHTWIDNNDDLYIDGVDGINGGTHKEPQKLGGNIVNSTKYALGVIAVDKDGNLYAYGKEKSNGFDKKYKELTKIDDLKDVTKVGSSISNVFFQALTKDGTVYQKKSDGKFEKVIDNAKDIIGGHYIITKDDEVYFSGNELTKVGKSLKVCEGGDPRNTVFVENNTIARISWDGEPLSGDKIDKLQKYYPTDIKEVIYHDIYEDKKVSYKYYLTMVYENTNGEIVLLRVDNCYDHQGEGKKTTDKVSKSVDDITKIWNFIKEGQENRL